MINEAPTLAGYDPLAVQAAGAVMGGPERWNQQPVETQNDQSSGYQIARFLTGVPGPSPTLSPDELALLQQKLQMSGGGNIPTGPF